jgi:erythrin-vacuolar iron transport family protein
MGDAFSPAMSSPLHDLERPRPERRITLRDRRGHLSRADEPSPHHASHAHVLQVVQPGLLGLMDGSVSTLAPLFATATLTGRTSSAFLVGLAASVGAGISMGLAEALSDDGQLSGRGKPLMRGVITGGGTVVGGMLHTLPFLLSNLHTALLLAYVVVVLELVAIAYIRYRWMRSPLGSTIVQVIIGGGIVFALGIWLGRFGAG